MTTEPVGLSYLDGLQYVAPGTFASLPTPAAGLAGVRTFITDLNNSVTTLLTALSGSNTGTGTNYAPVFCDGTNWRLG